MLNISPSKFQRFGVIWLLANVTLKCLVDDAAAANSAPFLQEEIISLKGLEVIAEAEQSESVQSASEPAAASAAPSPVAQESKPTEKKPAKPKWFKMWFDHWKTELVIPFSTSVPFWEAWFPIHISTVMLNLGLAPVGEL